MGTLSILGEVGRRQGDITGNLETPPMSAHLSADSSVSSH